MPYTDQQQILLVIRALAGNRSLSADERFDRIEALIAEARALPEAVVDQSPNED